jgi:flagellar hook-length control protein FliK
LQYFFNLQGMEAKEMKVATKFYEYSPDDVRNGTSRRSDEKRKSSRNDKFEDEIGSMVAVSVRRDEDNKPKKISREATSKPEIGEEKSRESKRPFSDENIKESVKDAQEKFGLKSKTSDGEILEKINSGKFPIETKADDSPKHFVLNVAGKNILLSPEQKDNIKKQIALLEQFEDSNIQMKLGETSVAKFAKETTNDLIAKHRDFLKIFKDKILNSSPEDVLAEPEMKINSEVKESTKEISSANKSFFSDLISSLASMRDDKNNIKLKNNVKSDSEESRPSLLNDLNREAEKIQSMGDVDKFGKDGNGGDKGSKGADNNHTLGDNNTFAKTEAKISNLINTNLIAKNSEGTAKAKGETSSVQNGQESRQFQFFNNIKLREIASSTLKAVKNMPDNSSGMARLTLSPPQLGKVFVEISIANNVARLSFKAESAEVVKAIESQIVNLAEKLLDKGITTESIGLDLTDRAKDEQNARENLKQQFAGKDDLKARQEFLDTFKKLNIESG